MLFHNKHLFSYSFLYFKGLVLVVVLYPSKLLYSLDNVHQELSVSWLFILGAHHVLVFRVFFFD
jgi:hypothetical protein